MSLGINTRITNTREQPSTFSRGKTLYVGGDGEGNFTKIQDAIDNEFLIHNNIYPKKWNKDYNPFTNTMTEDIYFTHPLNNDIFRAGENISINGTITGDGFKHYTVEYGQGDNPKEWHTTGIILVNDGNSPIIDDTIATWDTSHISQADFYMLRITVVFKETQNTVSTRSRETTFITIYLDPTLKEGWPKKLNWFKAGPHSYYWGGGAEAVVSDINNDGELEILVYMGGNPPKIYAFNPDGSCADGWPVEVDHEDIAGGNIEAPSTGDIDNDGYEEVFVNGEYGLYVYRYDGSFLRFIWLNGSMPTTLLPTTTVLSDLNNDGYLEIIRKFIQKNESSEKLAVFDSNGNMLENWPQTIYYYKGLDGNDHYILTFGFGFTQTVGDFDDDPDKEIVVTACRLEYADENDPAETFHHEGRVFVYNLDGTVLEGFPVDIDGEMAWSSPAVADIDNDGYDDIIVATRKTTIPRELKYCFPDTGIYVLDRYGNNLSGWPQLVCERFCESPAIADFNNDGYLEIIISDYGEDPFSGRKIYVFDYLGNILLGWPQSTRCHAYRSPVIGDVDCDGNLDVITTAGNGINGEGGVYAWNLYGTMIDGFPKVTEVDAQAGATIADLDNDGIVELIASSNWDSTESHHKKRSSVYVWELNSDFNQDTLDWPMFHHDSQHTGHYVRLNRSYSPPAKPIVDGPPSGKTGVEYSYTATTSDPDEDQVFYLFDWDDGATSGWLGPYPSGEIVEAKHSWNKMGNYEVKVKAKDVDGIWSFWSDPLSVTMPRNKIATYNLLFLKFLERFPLLERLLNLL